MATKKTEKKTKAKSFTVVEDFGICDRCGAGGEVDNFSVGGVTRVGFVCPDCGRKWQINFLPAERVSRGKKAN